MNSKLIIKAILITLLVPGTVTLVIPYFILRRSNIVDIPAISAVAIFTGIAGFAILLHCIWGFAVHGKGTLAPIDPPKALVVQGLYRYTRNPMYLAVIVVLLSEALFSRAPQCSCMLRWLSFAYISLFFSTKSLIFDLNSGMPTKNIPGRFPAGGSQHEGPNQKSDPMHNGLVEFIRNSVRRIADRTPHIDWSWTQ